MKYEDVCMHVSWVARVPLLGAVALFSSFVLHDFSLCYFLLSSLCFCFGEKIPASADER